MLKSINQQKVLQLIHSEGPISRVELSKRIGLTQQTVTNVVNRLLEDSIVLEGEPIPGEGGRRPIPLTVDKASLYAIGIEVAVKYVSGSLVNFKNEVIAEAKVDVTVFKHEEQPLACVEQIIQTLLRKASQPSRVQGIGCSIQGLVDAASGIVLRSPGLAWRNFPLKKRLESKFQLPVYIENDVNLLATVESYQGRLADADNSIILKLDYGIGGAVVFQNQLYPGSTHVAGEFGHYKAFTGSDALKCHCGGKGCLTTLASISGLTGHKKLTLEQFSRQVTEGNEEAVALFLLITRGVGQALANIVTFLNPDHVLLTGKWIETFGERLVADLRWQLLELTPESCRGVRLLPNEEPMNESVLAAGFAVKHFFEVPLNSLSL